MSTQHSENTSKPIVLQKVELLQLSQAALADELVRTQEQVVELQASVLALTDGGPAGSTQTIVYQILKDSFARSALGLGAAQSVILLIVTAAVGLAVTLIRRRAEQKVVDD